MSLIMGSIGQEKQELFAFELRKICELVFVYTLAFANIDQSAPNSQHHKISDEFDYRSNGTRLIRDICPLIKKNSNFDLVFML